MKHDMNCEICDAHVLNNSKHCRPCNRCTAEFDHHCSWINNCVGLSNYAHFMRMLILLNVVLTLQIVFSSIAIHLVKTEDDQDYNHTLLTGQAIKTLNSVTLGLTVPVLLYTLDLLRYHAILIYL